MTRLVHFACSGAIAGGVEHYLATLLATPGPFEHAVVFEEGDACRFAGAWPAQRSGWSTDRPADDRPDPGRLPDGVAVFHFPPSAATLDRLARDRRPAVLFCHDHRWWCPSGSRYHLRPERACAIRASGLACGVRYHALHCGSLRPAAVFHGFRRAEAGRRALADATLVLTASTYMRDEAIRHGASVERTYSVPLPVAATVAASVPPGAPVVLFASRLTPEKGPALLLEAFAQMREPARLVMAGTGISASAIASAVARHPRRTDIELTGALDPDAVRSRMRAATVVVVPSVWPEPFGLVGLEALAEGRPVVACASGGIADWARPELGGITVPPGRADLLAAALDRVLREPAVGQRALASGPGWVAAHHAPAVHLEHLRSALAAVGLA